MAVKDNEKNKEYVAKHRKAARATMGDEDKEKDEEIGHVLDVPPNDRLDEDAGTIKQPSTSREPSS